MCTLRFLSLLFHLTSDAHPVVRPETLLSSLPFPSTSTKRIHFLSVGKKKPYNIFFLFRQITLWIVTIISPLINYIIRYRGFLFFFYFFYQHYADKIISRRTFISLLLLIRRRHILWNYHTRFHFPTINTNSVRAEWSSVYCCRLNRLVWRNYPLDNFSKKNQLVSTPKRVVTCPRYSSGSLTVSSKILYIML